MMPTSELVALMLFAVAISFTPGPNTTLAAALGANRGLRGAMRFVVAVPCGWGLLLIGCALGLGGLIAAAPVLRGALKWVGLAYMLWLAWQLAGVGVLSAADPRRFDVGFAKGVMLQFVNLKGWLGALVISATWITAGDAPWARLALVLPLLMALGFASNLSYALLGSSLRGWLAQGRRLLVFNRVMAAVLAATAVWMAGL